MRAADDHLDDLGVAERRRRRRCAMWRPLRSTVRWSQKARTSRRRCEMKTIVTPWRLEAGDDLAEPVDVAAGERRGRLVEQQDARLAVDRAGDLDLLLDGEIELADLVARGRRRSRARRDARATALSAARRRIMPVQADRRVGQEHVVEDRQVADQRHLLERGLDAEARGRRAASRSATGLAEDREAAAGRAAIRPESSLTMVDLPAPFSPSSACTVPGAMRKRDVVDRDRGAEGLAHALDARRPECAALSHRHSDRAVDSAMQRKRRGGACAAPPVQDRDHSSGWPTSAALRPISGVCSEKIEANQPGLVTMRRREDVAAVLHLLPGAFLAELDRLVGDERQRQHGQLRRRPCLRASRRRASARERRNRAARRRRCAARPSARRCRWRLRPRCRPAASGCGRRSSLRRRRAAACSGVLPASICIELAV